ncbi:MAG: histidinol dehydrogenase [Spirochaetes bacterium]|nr:histidinol dehydrogenase [Spirochaetota bacterium]
MISIQNLKNVSEKELQKQFFRFGDDFTDIMTNTAIPIATDVKKNGDDAVKKYTEKFDKIKLDSVIAAKDEIKNGYDVTSAELIASFSKAIENIKEFHYHQKKENISYTRYNYGNFGLIYQPIENAGIYVPGGKAAYPSSVMMGVIPAQIAGVRNITLITPPGSDGRVNNSVCAVCHLLGVENIIKSGGAQGIAAAAFGTETVKKCNIIVGPGNIFVTAAKSYLFSLGIIQIDSLAGPSETVIIADKDANPKWIAYDLLSQAEHEENAAAVLLTDNAQTAELVSEEIQKDLNSGCGRHDIKMKVVQNNLKIYITDSIEEAVDFSNKYAPEHMQMMVANPEKYLSEIKNVGSLFLGYFSPVAVGDYFSGTNHILPTGGAARFSSGLSVDTFLRRTTYQMLTEEGLKQSVKPVSIMSKAEGFEDKHGGSVKIRFE